MTQPIVSLSGSPEVHERAQRYNSRLSLLRAAEEDLYAAESWNRYGRFNHGFMRDDNKPPQLTAPLMQRVLDLKAELEAERREIVELSQGTVKP